jgi:hypothetical protein
VDQLITFLIRLGHNPEEAARITRISSLEGDTPELSASERALLASHDSRVIRESLARASGSNGARTIVVR